MALVGTLILLVLVLGLATVFLHALVRVLVVLVQVVLAFAAMFVAGSATLILLRTTTELSNDAAVAGGVTAIVVTAVWIWSVAMRRSPRAREDRAAARSPREFRPAITARHAASPARRPEITRSAVPLADPTPSLVSASLTARVDAVRDRLAAAVARDPLDVQAIEWLVIFGRRVPELIATTGEVHDAAEPAARAGIRATLADHLTHLCDEADARAGSERRRASDRLAALHAYLAARVAR